MTTIRPGLSAFSLLVPLLLPWSAIGRDDGAGLEPRDRFEKSEHMVPMRDGVRLFTAVYRPRDAGPDSAYPILINRTPYGCRPYGEDELPARIGPSREMMEEGYIVVYQDVRGRYRSEGTYENMRPHEPGDLPIDESSDAYDTIEWLLGNVEGHNGRVGIWGISYPGFYAAASLPESHPALVAASPQAPIADFYFDDFHHNGAYTLSYFLITPVFGYQKDGPEESAWYEIVDPGTRDGYKFYLDLGPLKNADRYYGEDNVFWRQIAEHPNYDEFWRRRGILPHLDDVKAAVMVVGGWFDAEDLYGPLNIYQTLERENPGVFNMLVMGPWSHGDWARAGDAPQVVGNIPFGEGISASYQEGVEARFFRHFLKEGHDPDDPGPDLPEAYTFDTGLKRWGEFDRWPPRGAEATSIYLGDGRSLDREAPGPDDEQPFSGFVSDPATPVPDSGEIRMVMTPRAYMTDDQRFASRRPDVLSFRSEVLEEDVTLAGPIDAHLFVATTGTDADWVVKLIDVYPSDTPPPDGSPEGVEFGDYEQLVRGEILRGRFRDGFEEPVPFVPGEVTEVDVPLQDVYHTFRKGHRILVHVQSSWFPLFDRNPQTFVPNIFEADDDDFVAREHRVYHSAEFPSRLDVRILPAGD
ncbi:CocE/NonD family hydrolase [Tautonia plasticadhaerens]|uniref:Cocaine esterase n=1 Tax=Tautonia plasticadhaerens TaxID=2527974 RepID=A0A518H9H3_9BACT|nr:CocE/NonD family hydrolase [Tautonia plasticadhaerens]QDV37491.1 Cocaine esterase [Tautonia plasticadhaerens]